MLLRRAVVLCVLVGMASCSRSPEQPRAMTPTGPSLLDAPPGSLLSAPVPPAGKLDALFPPRNLTFDFYQRLIAKYRDGLRRSPSPTYVDPEGTTVWVQEYFRYVANGCPHETAVGRVFEQIDGRPAGFLCAPADPDNVVLFPPRNQSLAFQQQLEQKYLQMGRPLGSSFVDVEGTIVWLQEYLRYSTNACPHETSVANTLTQIDGNAAPPVCFVPPCRYVSSANPVNVPGGGGNFNFIMYLTNGECDWTASTSSSFITLTRSAGGHASAVEFSVGPNSGPARSGTINVRWKDGSLDVVVSQAGPQFLVRLQLFDTNKQTGETTECDVVLKSHQCRFQAQTFLPEGIKDFTWKAEYVYGSQKTVTSGASTFVVTEACGGPGSSPDGLVVEVVVTLTVVDLAGNTVTVVSGQGGQPTFFMRFRTC